MALKTGGDPNLILYGFRFSHFCVSVQLMLDHKRLPSRYREVPPGLHPFLLAGRGFRGRTVPAMRIDGADLAELPERLLEIEGWLQAGVLGGAEPNAADFQIVPSLRMLPLVPAVAPMIERGPLADYTHSVVPECPPPPSS